MNLGAARVLALVLVLAGCSGRAALTDGDAAYRAEIEAWHTEREAALAAEDGWLSLVGLHPIAPGVQTIGSGPEAALRLPDVAPALLGTLELSAQGELALDVAPGVDLRVDGETRAGRIPMATDADGNPTQVEIATLRLYAIERGGEAFLRVKDRASPARLQFTGVERFPVDPRWRVEARLEADSARSIAIPNVLGQVSAEPCPGRLVFTLAGKECALWPIGAAGEELFIIFADATSGAETYGAGRFLSAPAPGADGRVTLDFNRAVNPPCAFSPYATCPLPPAGNTLPVALRAGEKTWGEGH
jgi:uncharacterized protein (DUF1684 family)